MNDQSNQLVDDFNSSALPQIDITGRRGIVEQFDFDDEGDGDGSDDTGDEGEGNDQIEEIYKA